MLLSDDSLRSRRVFASELVNVGGFKLPSPFQFAAGQTHEAGSAPLPDRLRVCIARGRREQILARKTKRMQAPSPLWFPTVSFSISDKIFLSIYDIIAISILEMIGCRLVGLKASKRPLLPQMQRPERSKPKSTDKSRV